MRAWKKYVDVCEDIDKVDDYIRKSLRSNQQVLSDAVDELLSAGGKRLRPAMVLMAGRFGRYNEDRLIPMAATIEMIHMATLVHDDIIDKSDMRRGRPTIRNRWDNSTAVFTGDFILARAFSIITQNISQKGMYRLSNVIKGICEGEVDQFQSRYDSSLSAFHYLKRISRKTGMLFSLSCQIGAEESRCKKDTIHYLRKFGLDFGVAFQISDDILDFFGDQKAMGKPLCCDFVEGIYTLPIICAMENPQIKAQLANYIGRKNLMENEVQEVGRIVEKNGGLEKSRAMAKRYLDRCHNSLDRLPNIPAKKAFQEITDELMERSY
jgi:heptaprenyl diphosphate synthase